MPSITKIIQIDRDQTVQSLPDTKNGKQPHNLLTLGTTVRGPLLPARGSRERERALKEYYWNDYNTAFRAAIAGLSKRVQSTPWELTGPDDLTEYYQFVFMQADFGHGWEAFVGKVLLDYSRYDGGSYIELIGSGDPLEPLLGPITGLGVLDSLRCWPTGDPLFPVVYYDIKGKMHVLHHTRVVRFVDMLDPSEWAFDYGECSLSRCIAPVAREILMNRYIELTLDDNPPPGIFTFKNLSDKQLESAIQRMEMERSTDYGGTWGKVIRLYGLQTETMPEVQSVPFTTVPEKFDFDTYKTLNMKELALGIGLDIQDIWELTSGNLGTGTQSEILHQKSKGKALGRILKGFERVINLTLPPSVEFEFQYRDPDEDQQEATKAQTWATTTNMLANQLDVNEQRQMLVNQVEAVRDVATDQSGVMIRLGDSDPKAPGQVEAVTAPERESGAPTVSGTDDSVVADTETKSYVDTQRDFQQSFVQIVAAVQDGTIPASSAEMALRGQVQQAGERIWLDGLRDGGIENPVIDDDAVKAISAWRAQQNGFIQAFVSKLLQKETTPEQAAQSAQMWVNKSLNNLYHAALGAADAQQLWMWIVNPIKEHCDTCLRMNGQIHKMKEFLKTGIVPQASSLECKGYNCGCKLVKSSGRSRGRIPSVGRGGLGSLFGRIAGAFRRLIGKEIHLKKDQPRDEIGRFGEGGGSRAGGGDDDGGNGDGDGGKFRSVADDKEFNDKWSKDMDSIKSEKGPPPGDRVIKSTTEYTDESYTKINGTLRGTEQGILEPETITQIQDLDNLTNRRMLDQDITVFRKDEGGGLPNGGFLNDDEFKALKGGTFKDPGFTSTTVNPDATGNIFGDVSYEYRIPKGSRGAYVDSVSANPKEKEFLMGRNTQSRIVDARVNDDGSRSLVMEVISDG